MRKSAWFLAASLTAFIITMLAGVVYGYNGLSFIGPVAAQSAAAAVLPTATQPSDPTQAPVSASTPLVASISPQSAAAIAAKSLKRTDLYSVQLASINGLGLYKVTFTSGDVVYVSMDGQVVLSVPAPVPPPSATTASVVAGSTAGRGGGGGGGGGGHHSGGGGGDDGGGGGDN